MLTRDFDYELPEERIAQEPAPRGESRLLVLDAEGPQRHRRVRDLPALLQPGDLLVLNDAVFNMDTKKDALGHIFTTLLGSAPGPRVSRLAKMALIADQSALRQDLERFAATPDLVRMIVAHEKVAHGADAPAALRQAATYLR